MIGFRLIEKSDGNAYLSANGKYPYLLNLEVNKNAKPLDRHSAGLYHTAFRFPDRNSLGMTFLHLHENKVKFHGFSDHIVSEAIYLGDPDGNGVELYVDKPKSEWEWQQGQITMDSLPLDLSKITNEITDKDKQYSGVDEKTIIGHIHLRVTELFKAEKFYSNFIGMNITNSSYNGALFMSAGGYHHHIGANIWSSANGSYRNEDELGLKSFTISIPDSNYINELKNKSKQNGFEYIDVSKNNGIQVKDLDNIRVKILVE
jgi:catechol 2,3-dioxygenase